MRCITLASGSKGNCAYIESEGRAILDRCRSFCERDIPKDA